MTQIVRLAGLLGLLMYPGTLASAMVPVACTVSATGLDFGQYHSSLQPVMFTGTIRVFCRGGAATFSVALTAGSSGNIMAREMRVSSGAMLRYQLYLDAARTEVWGDGATGGIAGPITASSANLTVYGVLFGGQHVPAGQAADTVQVILNN